MYRAKPLATRYENPKRIIWWLLKWMVSLSLINSGFYDFLKKTRSRGWGSLEIFLLQTKVNAQLLCKLGDWIQRETEFKTLDTWRTLEDWSGLRHSKISVGVSSQAKLQNIAAPLGGPTFREKHRVELKWGIPRHCKVVLLLTTYITWGTGYAYSGRLASMNNALDLLFIRSPVYFVSR